MAVSVHRTAAEQHTEQRGNSMIGRPFKKGQSGNPGGRPKVVAEIRQLARERGPEAIAALVKVMTKGKSEAARVAAANALLDRGWGRPKPSDETEITHRYVVELPSVLTKAEWLAKYGRALPRHWSRPSNGHLVRQNPARWSLPQCPAKRGSKVVHLPIG